jgi:hypothetical protein
MFRMLGTARGLTLIELLILMLSLMVPLRWSFRHLVYPTRVSFEINRLMSAVNLVGRGPCDEKSHRRLSIDNLRCIYYCLY